jgi:hypothetical protein
MIFRLTKKAAAKLRVKLAPAGADHPSLVDWYCNVATAQRRQFLLFTQATTLFSFWVPVTEVRRGDFGRVFRLQAVEALRDYGFTDDDLAKIVDEGPDIFTASADRGVLGSMVDYAKMLQYTVEYQGGLQRLSRRTMNDIANKCPMSMIGMKLPAEYLHEVLRAAGAA